MTLRGFPADQLPFPGPGCPADGDVGARRRLGWPSDLAVDTACELALAQLVGGGPAAAAHVLPAALVELHQARHVLKDLRFQRIRLTTPLKPSDSRRLGLGDEAAVDEGFPPDRIPAGVEPAVVDALLDVDHGGDVDLCVEMLCPRPRDLSCTAEPIGRAIRGEGV